MPDSPRQDSRSDAFEQSLDDVLERVSESIRAEHAVHDRMRKAHAKRAARSSTHPPPAPGPGAPRAPTPRAPTPRAPTPRDNGVARRVAWSAASLLGLGAAILWAVVGHPVRQAPVLAYESLPPPAAGVARPAPLAARPVVENPRLPTIAVDAEASTESLMLGQLAGAGGDAAAATDARPAFAIARYDSLRALSPGWQVLAPLHVEEVYAIVPIASPLRDLGDLRGRRINVGAPGSARARSGEALYRELFGQALPVSTLRSATRDAALRALLDGGGLDALIVFDGQPSAWLASLPADTRRRLRLLSFDPHGASARRVLRTWLSTSLAPASGGASLPTLGEVSFLVGAPQALRTPQLLQALCERLPTLRVQGHPKWKQVDPTLQLPVNLARSPELAKALQGCPSPVTVVPSSTSSSGVPS